MYWRKKNKKTPPCLLHFDDAFEYCVRLLHFWTWKMFVKYKKTPVDPYLEAMLRPKSNF